MTFKTLDVIGVSVIDSSNGQSVGKIEDFILDPQIKQVKVVGVKLKTGGKEYLPFNEIKAISQDAILIEKTEALKKEPELESDVAQIVKDDVDTTHLSKTKIVTQDGKSIGVIRDMVVNSENGDIEYFEVSQGIKDIWSGRKHLSVSDILVIGKDTTIVKSGVFGQSTNNKGTRPPDYPSAEKSALTEQRKAEKEGGKTNFAVTVSSPTLPAGKEEVVGKYLTKNILSRRDEIIGKRGDIITHELLNKAEQNGVLDQFIKFSASAPPDVFKKYE
jgi:uncharacterized protein YrrD